MAESSADAGTPTPSRRNTIVGPARIVSPLLPDDDDDDSDEELTALGPLGSISPLLAEELQSPQSSEGNLLPEYVALPYHINSLRWHRRKLVGELVAYRNLQRRLMANEPPNAREPLAVQLLRRRWEEMTTLYAKDEAIQHYEEAHPGRFEELVRDDAHFVGLEIQLQSPGTSWRSTFREYMDTGLEMWIPTFRGFPLSPEAEAARDDEVERQKESIRIAKAEREKWREEGHKKIEDADPARPVKEAERRKSRRAAGDADDFVRSVARYQKHVREQDGKIGLGL